MIKTKIGTCIDCNNDLQVPIIANRCKYHYWAYRSNIKPAGNKKSPKHTIPKATVKRLKQLKEYSELRVEFLYNNRICVGSGIIKGCTKNATEIHHKRGKIGELLIDVNNFAAICRNCHEWITENSKEAIELNLSEKRNQ